MPNERKTEAIVRSLLEGNGYSGNSNVVIEEQSSDNPKIDKLLKQASKQGIGQGYPEFIISFKDRPDDIIVIECKADVTRHESPDRTNYKEYAVDGVLLYASFLKDVFNTVAIAVSGETEREVKIAHFLWLRGNITYKAINDKHLLDYMSLIDVVTKQSKPIKDEELVKKAIEYNKVLHSHSIPEAERCTLISAILVALQDNAFVSSYKSHHTNQGSEDYNPNASLVTSLLNSCENVLQRSGLSSVKRNVIIGEYGKIRQVHVFNSPGNTILRDLIDDLNDSVVPYVSNEIFDVLGKFYTQFIRYAGSDKKTGLVLTPTHITDLFCDISEVTEQDVVLDPCCGTGGFLVSAMKYMLARVGSKSETTNTIKGEHLIGIEKRADMFSHVCSNMMMRGDGKSHIYYDDCFDEEMKSTVASKKPTKTFLNPPYDIGEAGQLRFIENAIDCMQAGGMLVAICQMSTVVSGAREAIEVRNRLIEKNTLVGVMSMPDALFHPIGVITCIIIIRVGVPHAENTDTFFGYFKDDGFLKIKNMGRIDVNDRWNVIRSTWLDAYVNKRNIPGLSVLKKVRAEDEWCAEAYMRTDFKSFVPEDFEESVRSFVGFQFKVGNISGIKQGTLLHQHQGLFDVEWRYFNYSDLFTNIQRGRRLIENDREDGDVLYFSASEENNGCTDRIANPLFVAADSIIYTTFGDAYYVSGEFTASDEVTIFGHGELNIMNGVFIATVMSKNKYKYSFGRKAFRNKFMFDLIPLPVDNDLNPNWKFMENYIRSLPYSINLCSSK